jgi:hypothetical protein
LKARCLDTRKSVGRVICHDITKIEKGAFKGALFKKGHIIREEDVEVLLDIGKSNIYIIELAGDELHEDEAGQRIADALCGPGVVLQGPAEGRVDLRAGHKGLLKVDSARTNRINAIKNVAVSTLHTNSPVDSGDMLAGCRVIPLVVKEMTVKRVEKICAGTPPVTVVPYQALKLGVVVTGREVAEGRIRDGFVPVLQEKASSFGLEAPEVLFAADEKELIAAAIKEMLGRGCTMVIVTGGMSVDPDDVTPGAIKKTGAKIVKYGAPVLPGAMFMLAYMGKVPIIGLPACAMYFKTTVLDLFLPRIMAGEEIRARDITMLGHGGLCRRCTACVFPNCSFGKGAN